MLTKLHLEPVVDQSSLSQLLEKLPELGIEWGRDTQTGQVYLEFPDGRVCFTNLLLLKAFVAGCIRMMEYPQHLNSKIHQLEQHHCSYVRSQQEMIPEIGQNCSSLIQEVDALRLLIHRGEGECREYLRELQVNRRRGAGY